MKRQVEGNIIDIYSRKILAGIIHIQNGYIDQIEITGKTYDHYILPGFIDAHIHIESSMLVPREFARIAVNHGTVATVSDPHEIANVLGIAGVRYMIENGKTVPLKFHFGAPSCVPATTFETAGAVITSKDIEEMLTWEEVLYLAEMMNYPGVLFQDEEVMKKIAAAKRLGKPIDGHAPGLTGDDAIQYIQAGITTDHECFTYEEALHKLLNGMKIIIREGSAAKNFEELWPLIDEFPDKVMLCSDDLHPDNLMEGHINLIVQRALAKGCNLYDVLQVACINPVLHYNLPVGTLRVGEEADFIIVNNTKDFDILETWINGNCVSDRGLSMISYDSSPKVNLFDTSPITAGDLALKAESEKINVIKAGDGQLITGHMEAKATIANGYAVSNVDGDILKIAVVNRYSSQKPAIAFIHNFGIKHGAIASCVAHDSHNIIAVGTDDILLSQAINAIIENKGGISATDGTITDVLPLPIAGIMTGSRAEEVAETYQRLDNMSKKMGSTLSAPFMTLSFMALLVIPALKLSDKGLFDGRTFSFTRVFI